MVHVFVAVFVSNNLAFLSEVSYVFFRSVLRDGRFSGCILFNPVCSLKCIKFSSVFWTWAKGGAPIHTCLWHSIEYKFVEHFAFYTRSCPASDFPSY